SGPITAARIGDGGGSNFTFLIERGGERLVLRRPPRPPLPPSAHDMVREARLQNAIRSAGFVRLPDIVAVCDDESVIGVPFYIMRYLDRQVRRWQQLWGVNATRDLPGPELGERVAASVPEPLPDAVVHGDYRIGNVIVAEDEPRIAAVLDWEMGAIGDPRADVGYLVATYMEPGGPPTALGTSPATAAEGFPSRAELIARYEERTGRVVERLGWFEALAWWKAAVFCEAIYGRYVRGELGEAPQAARFEQGVPLMVEAAFAALERDSG
ncbi:MAG TPA: phosphotransferase family protein, partial [Gaiellaceae bacterium]|nr:phosphotransferase family protein [Gaiellaceae bacterium]